MPNWCDNTLTMGHEDPKMIARAKRAFNNGGFLNEFIPCPEGEDWYSFNCENWGTKWDVGSEGYFSEEELNSEDSTDFSVCFDSAWAPPISAYERLEELGFTIEAYYYEPGMGFCGKYEGGIDDSYNIEGNSSWVEDNIPGDIIEVFDLVNSMAMWEEEEEEEE